MSEATGYVASFPRQFVRRAKCRGFSLLELMIVMLLATVLLAMAIPSYQQYVLRVRRATAIEALLAIAQCQQALYAQALSYDTRRCLPDSTDGYYLVRMDPPNTASTLVFTAIASPLATQQLDPCQELSLDQSGWRGISGQEELQRKCWEGR